VTACRAGFVPEWFAEGKAGAAERAALAALERSGLELVEITAPELPFEVVLTLLFVEAAASFQELTLTNRDDELRQQEPNSWPNRFRTAHYTSAVEYVQLQRLRRKAMEAMRDVFEQAEILAAPGMGAGLSPITNATGHPSLTLPVGFRDDGTPAAITLHGRLYDEATLCRVGMVLEAELGLSARPPLGLS
jgi:Asp-tRNA(Asn)/Glu-tRNA(Gln) amidotransferase A subunit family amidase